MLQVSGRGKVVGILLRTSAYEHPKIVCGGGGGVGALDILQALDDIHSADVTTPNMLATFPYHSDSDRDGLHGGIMLRLRTPDACMHVCLS